MKQLIILVIVTIAIIVICIAIRRKDSNLKPYTIKSKVDIDKIVNLYTVKF